MAGANYMGGKRNAIKARSKDIASRLRRDHFGKQRLNLQAHGVVRNDTQSLEPRPKAAAIDLEHARRDFSRRELPTGTYIPQPTKPKDAESRSVGLFARSLSRSKPSKLLTALEKYEPISFRSKKDRLLRINDFAGLVTRPEETAVVSEKQSIVLPGRKRKVDDSSVHCGQIEKRRRASPLPIGNGSSSTDFPPSPSPAFSGRPLAPCSETSSIYSFQLSVGYSEISSDDHASVAACRTLNRDVCEIPYTSPEVKLLEDDLVRQGEQNSGDGGGIERGFVNQGNAWETSDISEASTHPPSGSGAADLIEMSNEWRSVEDYLQVGDFQRKQATCPQENQQVFGKLGLDFYVFPFLKPRALDSIDALARKFPEANNPSDTSFTPSRTILPITLKRWGSEAAPSVSKGEKPKGSHIEPFVLSGESSRSAPPVDTSPSIMEVLEYDTQSESQQSDIYVSRVPQSPSGGALGFAGISAHQHSTSANINASNEKLLFTSSLEELPHNILTGLDHSDDPEGFPMAQFYPILSCDSPMENHSTTAVGAINVEIPVRTRALPKDLHQSDDTTDPDRGAGSNSKNNFGDVASVDLNACKETSFAFAQAVHLEDGTTPSDHDYPAVFQSYTQSKEASKGGKTSYADSDQGAESKGFIGGPLLFALDNEVGDEE